MKWLIVTVLVLNLVRLNRAGGECTRGESGVDLPLKELSGSCSNCTKLLLDQVQTEFKASFTYLGMAAHFMNERNHRPGLAKFFLDSANEERTHGKEIMKYGLMRGLTDVAGKLGKFNIDTTEITTYNVKTALKAALELEKEVTKQITRIIKACDACKDGDGEPVEYHVSDYLTGDFLTEQMQSMRQLGEYLTTLERLSTPNMILKELMFDRTLPQD